MPFDIEQLRGLPNTSAVGSQERGFYHLAKAGRNGPMVGHFELPALRVEGFCFRMVAGHEP